MSYDLRGDDPPHPPRLRPQRLLPRSVPSAQGMDAASVLALLDRLSERSVECHSIMVVRHGHVVAEGWWEPYSADRPHLLYSLTKSFLSVAVGFAVSDGLLSLDDRVAEVLDDHVPAEFSARARQLSVRHLLTMTTGHRADTLADAWRLEPADLVKGFLRVPAPDPVGTRHAYNNPTTFVLARMVERVTGLSVPELLDDRLFGPMGVEGAEWDRVASGATFGFHGLHLRTEAVAAFGELMLRRGRWRGQQLITSDWVDQATSPQVQTLQSDDGWRTTDWLQGYGYQFWMSRHGYRGDGAMGQYCLVVPQHDLVVAMTAAANDLQAPLDAVWDCLLPGTRGAGSPGDDQLLAERLRQLSLPQPTGDAGPGRAVTAIIDAAAGDPALPPGTSVTVSPADGGWLVRFDPGSTTLSVDVGHGTWRESAPLGRPVVAAGAWQGAAFIADLYVITGPSRLRLVVETEGAGGARGRPPAGHTSAPRAVVTWNIAPLTGPDLLRQLRSPLMTRPDVA
jgi:CubicO group peptidase (beta-lactamase class C family)